MPTRRKPRTARRRRTKPKPRIPAGFHTITPYLAVVGGAAAMDFYKKAFGARELLRQLTPDGKLIHGRLKIGDSMLFLSDVFQGSDRTAPSTLETTTVALHVYTTDVETLWNRAVAAGATVTMPLEDQFWGERYGHLRDPFGHHWSLSMPIRMSRKEREEKRRAAMAMFDRGEHPSHEPPESDA